MKKITVLISAAAALMAVGCAKDGGVKGERNGVLTVGIKSQAHTRAVTDATNTDTVVEAFEDNVYGFSAYVFNWATGDLEGSVTSTDGQPVTLTGLNNAGTKRVLVIANGDRTKYASSLIPEFKNDSSYSRLAQGYLALADQTFTDFTDTSKGFLMTGENATALQLVAGNNTVSIPVERVVSKVMLGDITFDDAIQVADLAQFDLSAAMIQRAAGYSTLGAGDISTPASPMAIVGGETGSITTSTATGLIDELDFQTWLNTLFTTTFNYTGTTDPAITSTVTVGQAKGSNTVPAFTVPAFWYVLPNNDVDKFTLMTLKGSYNGTDGFYPIEINDADADGPSVTQDYVKRNTIYKINLHFKNLSGIADPDLPGVAANIEVSIDPQDWEGPVVQNSVW